MIAKKAILIDRCIFACIACVHRTRAAGDSKSSTRIPPLISLAHDDFKARIFECHFNKLIRHTTQFECNDVTLVEALFLKIHFSFCDGCLAEASCTSVIAAAQDVVSDIGPQAASKSGGLVDISKCSMNNPERDCQRVLVNKFGLALPVQKTKLGSDDKIPMLRIQHWFEFFARNSCLHILHGLKKPHPVRERAILQAFWKNWSGIHPKHGVFSEAAKGTLALDRAIPLLVHGDEGRGRKHGAHFVLSFHSILGKGFAKRKSSRVWAKMENNFAGHTYCNRFLITSLRKRDYTDMQSETWPTLMSEVAKDAGFMWKTGVTTERGLQYWGVVLAITGDWPFLHKSGQFTRSFNTIQKRLRIRQAPAGICHLCRSGQPDCPFEQLETRRPDWIATQFVQDPFVEPSPFSEHLLHEEGKAAALWSYDWFHAMHLGVIRNFVGSVIALMTETEPEGNKDDRFAAFTTKYRQWCHGHSKRAYCTKITKESIAWETNLKFPSAQWHKGGLSTVMMEFIEYRFRNETFEGNESLKLAAEACFAIQDLSRTLYRAPMWLKPEHCLRCAELGFKFLRRYGQLASLSKRLQRPFFVLQPKIHLLQHFCVDLHSAFQKKQMGLNPLSKSCQPSEDFIGRPSRLSRRVTAQDPVLHRIMSRYLQSAYGHFIKAGYLVRTSG